MGGWNEQPTPDDAAPTPRLATVEATFAYHGDLEGSSVVQYVLSYPAVDGAVPFVGYEVVDGTLAGQEGTFAVRHVGTYGPEGVRADWLIHEGSATGGLEGLSGTGGYAIELGKEDWSWSLRYELP